MNAAPIFNKVLNLNADVLKVCERMPKFYQQTLGVRMSNSSMDLLGRIGQALRSTCPKAKIGALELSLNGLDSLYVELRFAQHLNLLSQSFYPKFCIAAEALREEIVAFEMWSRKHAIDKSKNQSLQNSE